MADETEVLEEQKTETTTETKGTGKIISAGQPIPFKVFVPTADSPLPPEATAAPIADTDAGKQEAVKTETTVQAAATAAAIQTKEVTADLTDEQLKELYEQRFPQATTLTDEQKVKQAQELEKRMLDLYVEHEWGDIAQFAELKRIAESDLTDLSKSELTKQLKEAGITDDEQIKAIQKERFYQIEQAEIDDMDDETEKALSQKKFDYGKKEFDGIGTNLKNEATNTLDNLKKALTAKDFYTQKESEFTSNVEEHFNKLERKTELQLGKVDDIELSPVAYEYPESVIAESKEALKDITKRKQLLFNTDGSLNIGNIANLLIKANAFDSAAKTSFLEGQTRQVEEFRKVFPIVDPKAIGVGGSSQSQPGKGTGRIVKAGQPQRFNIAGR